MSITIAVRSEQFGDTQLTSDHFNTNISYASFTIDSATQNTLAGAVANVNDLSNLESSLTSDLQALVATLGAGIDSSDYSLGNITLASNAQAPNNSSHSTWTEIIEALDGAIKLNEDIIGSTTLTTTAQTLTAAIEELHAEINSNDTDILNLQQALQQESQDRANGDTNLQSNIDALRADVNGTLGATVASPTGWGHSGTNYLDAQTSVKDALEALDGIIDLLEGNVESRLGISDIADATSFNLASSTYLQNSSSVADALGALDAAINSNDTDISGLVADLAQEILDRTNADTNLQNNIDAEALTRANADTQLSNQLAALQSELDTTQSNIGTDAGGVYTSGANTHATTDNIKTDIDALDQAIVDNTTLINNLGSAFEYVGTIDVSVASTVAATPTTLASIISNDPNITTETGDYYRLVSSANVPVYIQDANGNVYAVVDGDALVFNSLGGFDRFDNSDPTVIAGSNITVSKTGKDIYDIAVSATFEGRVTQAETDIDALEVFTGLGTNLDTGANDLADAINELHGEINANDLDIAQLVTDLAAEAQARQAGDANLQGQIDTNDLDILNLQNALAQEVTDRTNGDISLQTNIDAEEQARIAGDAALQTEIDAMETALGLENDGTKTDFNSTNFITGAGTFKDAIEELDSALQLSQTVDTGRLTVAPMTHQYVAPSRLTMGGDLEEYASATYEGNGTNGYTGGVTSGVIRRGDASASFLGVSGSENGYVVLGALLSNDPASNHSASQSHLVSNLYWYNTRVYKNGIRLFQRSSFPVGANLSADQYTVKAVTYAASYDPNGNGAATTWAELTDDTASVRRYPAKIPYYVESAYRNSVTGLGIGSVDPDAGQRHPLAGQVNTDAGEQLNDTVPAPLQAVVDANNNVGLHGNANQVAYYKVEFGGVLDQADVIVVDYMGSTN